MPLCTYACNACISLCAYTCMLLCNFRSQIVKAVRSSSVWQRQHQEEELVQEEVVQEELVHPFHPVHPVPPLDPPLLRRQIRQRRPSLCRNSTFSGTSSFFIVSPEKLCSRSSTSTCPRKKFLS